MLKNLINRSILFDHNTKIFKKFSTKKQIIAKHKIFPLELFRIATTKNVNLRDYEDQMKKKSTKWDFKLKDDGLIHPAIDDTFIGVYIFHAFKNFFL